jgi:hypothetical protein
MKIKSFLTVLTLTILSICIPACGSQPTTDSIAGLQQKIPFTIILPKYFPKGIDPSKVSTSGPEKDLFVRDAVALRIGVDYGKVGANPSISITEENNETMFMQSDPTTVTLDINGTPVLEDEKEISKPTHHLEYDWNYRGINIKVLIYGYEKIECEKIVESMIPTL